MKTYSEARAQLPTDTTWSSSFGNPGEQGYSEYWRMPDGARWVLENGPWHLIAPEWTCKPLDGAAKATGSTEPPTQPSATPA